MLHCVECNQYSLIWKWHLLFVVLISWPGSFRQVTLTFLIPQAKRINEVSSPNFKDSKVRVKLQLFNEVGASVVNKSQYMPGPWPWLIMPIWTHVHNGYNAIMLCPSLRSTSLMIRLLLVCWSLSLCPRSQPPPPSSQLGSKTWLGILQTWSKTVSMSSNDQLQKMQFPIECTTFLTSLKWYLPCLDLFIITLMTCLLNQMW